MLIVDTVQRERNCPHSTEGYMAGIITMVDEETAERVTLPWTCRGDDLGNGLRETYFDVYIPPAHPARKEVESLLDLIGRVVCDYLTRDTEVYA